MGETDHLQGLSAAALDTVRGMAYVLRTHEDPLHVPEGAIVVARTIHPDMAPLFWRIKAAVVEEGGLVQHAATLANEFGIPCVVAAANATSAIVTGDVLEVDGATGHIRKITK